MTRMEGNRIESNRYERSVKCLKGAESCNWEWMTFENRKKCATTFLETKVTDNEKEKQSTWRGG